MDKVTEGMLDRLYQAQNEEIDRLKADLQLKEDRLCCEKMAIMWIRENLPSDYLTLNTIKGVVSVMTQKELQEFCKAIAEKELNKDV